MTGDQLTLLLNLIVSSLLPALVGLVTTRSQSSAVRAVLLLVLAFINTLIGQIIVAVNTGDFQWFMWLATGIASFVVAVSTHFGFWKPIGASDKLVAVGSK